MESVCGLAHLEEISAGPFGFNKKALEENNEDSVSEGRNLKVMTLIMSYKTFGMTSYHWCYSYSDFIDNEVYMNTNWRYCNQVISPECCHTLWGRSIP